MTFSIRFIFKLLMLFCCTFLCACKNDKNNTRLKSTEYYANDTLKLFSVFEKDSAYFIYYHYKKQTNKDGNVIYTYNNNEAGRLIVICDTANKYVRLVINDRDTTLLENVESRHYIINRRQYNVLKLVSDKGVTDGEVSYFFNTDFGLLFTKSNTWREGKFLNPQKTNDDYLQLTVLVYRVLTDQEFFINSPPELKMKFAPPKVE